MPRDKLQYRERYKKGSMCIRSGALPTLYHTNNSRVLSCEIQEAGVIEREGKRLEFQVLRVVLEPKD